MNISSLLMKFTQIVRKAVESVKWRHFNRAASVAGVAGMIFFAIWCGRKGLLTDPEVMQAYFGKHPVGGGILFILIQIIQVAIPIVPGGVSIVAGVAVFGAVKGFIYNYIGICIGSMIVFQIARKYGRKLMHEIFSEKTINKYDHWTEKRNRFTRLFAAAVFLPGLPDDFLCYLAGTTSMKFRTFAVVILLGKPFSIACYSMGFNYIFQNFISSIFH